MAIDFCADCIAHSANESAGNVGTVNAIGSMFYGWTKRCSACGSRVKTLWLVFAAFPLFPGGSFRVLDLGDSRFLSRRVPLHQGQVVATWLVAYLVLVLVLGLWAGIDVKAFKKPGVDVIVGCSFVFPCWVITALAVLGLKRLLGDGLSFFIGFLCFVGLMVAACFAVWGYLDFASWPESVRVACAFLATLVLVVLPGVPLAIRVHAMHRP
jgi:hypothetical protein